MIKKAKTPKKGSMRPVFKVCWGVVVILRRECGGFGGVKTETFTHDDRFRWYVVNKKCFKEFL